MKKEMETKTFCLRDSKNFHYWISLGVISNNDTGTVFEVLKCSQCNKMILEKLEEITRVYS